MSALYLSMSKDHASSSPERQALTSFVSFHAAGGFFAALVKTGLIGWHSPSPFWGRAAPHSRVRTVPERRDENCRWSFWRRQEYSGWPGKSWADSRPEPPSRGRKFSSAARRCVRTFAPRSNDRFPLPTEVPGARAGGGSQ